MKTLKTPLLSPFAENLGRKPVDKREELSASEGFRSRRSSGEKVPRASAWGASLVLALTFLNLILLLVNIGAISVPKKAAETLKWEDSTKKVREIKTGEEAKIAGYKIKFTNPRYEYDEESVMQTFKIDVALTNFSFKPFVSLIANCNLIDSGKTAKEGAGVFIRAKDDHVVLGKSLDWQIVVPLEIDYKLKSQSFEDDRKLPGGHEPLFPNRRVSFCVFTPSGSYDPNIAVKVVFE